MHPITRERERNDPFEPDDDDDAKISLTFFLTQDSTHYWTHARAHKKKTERETTGVVLVFFPSSLVFLKRVVVSSGQSL